MIFILDEWEVRSYTTILSPCYHGVGEDDIKLKGAKSEIVILVTHL